MEWADIRKLLSPWLLLPLTALDWWLAWGRLPDRVVMKLGPNGQPIHWATREQAMTFDLALLAGVLVFTTVLVFATGFAQPEKAGRAFAGAVVCDVLLFLTLNAVLWIYQAS